MTGDQDNSKVFLSQKYVTLVRIIFAWALGRFKPKSPYRFPPSPFQKSNFLINCIAIFTCEVSNDSDPRNDPDGNGY